MGEATGQVQTVFRPKGASFRSNFVIARRPPIQPVRERAAQLKILEQIRSVRKRRDHQRQRPCSQRSPSADVTHRAPSHSRSLSLPARRHSEWSKEGGVDVLIRHTTFCEDHVSNNLRINHSDEREGKGRILQKVLHKRKQNFVRKRCRIECLNRSPIVLAAFMNFQIF